MRSPPARWSRSFRADTWSFPVLLASFGDPAQATKIVRDLSDMPALMDERYPIAHWTPRKKITEEQQELRRLLSILQGNTDELPWQIEDDLAVEFDSLNGEEFEKWMKASRERDEKQQALRQEWIANEQASAMGIRLELLKAFTRFEADTEQWGEKRLEQRRQQQDVDAEEPELQVAPDPAPVLANYLTPILHELGYFDDDDSFNRFAAMTGATEITAEELENTPPLSGSLVEIHIYQGKDPAASIGAVMAWLKNNGATGLTWSYSEGVLPEDGEDVVAE